eukprot:TRINITY_DN953_c0_g1_i1.p1 TRINITY_DN953_c0_g1~~TRINITY_DN953_c0_g1_i1.p1  ORF type:complete len:145 (+),score=31.70 TRINITY_DN953_c0_g1_i1:78-512(+)
MAAVPQTYSAPAMTSTAMPVGSQILMPHHSMVAPAAVQMPQGSMVAPAQAPGYFQWCRPAPAPTVGAPIQMPVASMGRAATPMAASLVSAPSMVAVPSVMATPMYSMGAVPVPAAAPAAAPVASAVAKKAKKSKKKAAKKGMCC